MSIRNAGNVIYGWSQPIKTSGGCDGLGTTLDKMPDDASNQVVLLRGNHCRLIACVKKSTPRIQFHPFSLYTLKDPILMYTDP